jgi:hypothetical protein
MKATSALLAAFVLCGAAAGAQAQAQDYAAPVQKVHSEWEYPGMMGMGMGHPGMMGYGHQGMMGYGQPGMMGYGQPGMMGYGQPGMMGMGEPGMMGMGGGGHFRMMMPMMLAMMDTNNDGALSLEEVQAVHARMFNFIDKNKDGKVTLDEVQAAFSGGAAPAQPMQPQQQQ